MVARRCETLTARGVVDLIITDFSMPSMTGTDFAGKARQGGYTGPMLYMTSAKFIEQYNKDKRDLDIAGLIIKPFNKDDIRKTLRAALKLQGTEK
jgi:two-component SAPR family response regulator